MDSFGSSQGFHMPEDNLINGECFLAGSRCCEQDGSDNEKSN